MYILFVLFFMCGGVLGILYSPTDRSQMIICANAIQQSATDTNVFVTPSGDLKPAWSQPVDIKHNNPREKKPMWTALYQTGCCLPEGKLEANRFILPNLNIHTLKILCIFIIQIFFLRNSNLEPFLSVLWIYYLSTSYLSYSAEPIRFVAVWY